MITIPGTHRYHPDTKVLVQITSEDKMTGDGIFANSDLMRVKKRGYAIINVVGDSVDHELYVPQENHKDAVANYLPVLQSGTRPDQWNMVNYKVPLKAHESLHVTLDQNTGTQCCALGMMFELDENGNCPIADNTPDIVISKPIVATTQNALIGTDLEGCEYSGWMYVWLNSNQLDTQFHGNQRNHRPGNYSLTPSDGTGTACYCNYDSAWKTWISRTDVPQVPITEVTGMAAFLVVAFFIRDSRYHPFGS